MYNFSTVLYQFLETGTSDKTFMGRDQELKWLAFGLYPLSFFLYSPFNLYKSKNWTTREKLKRRWEIIWNKWLCLRVRNKAHTKYIQTDNQLSQAELSRPTVVPTWHDIFLQKVFDCHITSTFCMQYFLSLFRFQRILKYPWIQMCAYWSCTPVKHNGTCCRKYSKFF